MSNPGGDDPEFDYEHEPRRIRKGSPWARKFFGKVLGIKSARQRRIDEAEAED